MGCRVVIAAFYQVMARDAQGGARYPRAVAAIVASYILSRPSGKDGEKS